MSFRMFLAAATAMTGVACAGAAHAQAHLPNDLIVSGSVYVDPGFGVGTALPNSSGATTIASSAFCTTANCSGNVWNNDSVDGNFGITSPIYFRHRSQTKAPGVRWPSVALLRLFSGRPAMTFAMVAILKSAASSGAILYNLPV